MQVYFEIKNGPQRRQTRDFVRAIPMHNMYCAL